VTRTTMRSVYGYGGSMPTRPTKRHCVKIVHILRASTAKRVVSGESLEGRRASGIPGLPAVPELYDALLLLPLLVTLEGLQIRSQRYEDLQRVAMWTLLSASRVLRHDLVHMPCHRSSHLDIAVRAA